MTRLRPNDPAWDDLDDCAEEGLAHPQDADDPGDNAWLLGPEPDLTDELDEPSFDYALEDDEEEEG